MEAITAKFSIEDYHKIVIDEQGEKKAVLIDLNEWGELWEDFYDLVVSCARKDELEVSWEDLKRAMEEENKQE